jgi:hypothetical protein
MIRQKGSDRRQCNAPVEVERRGSDRDRRKCPSCGEALHRHIRKVSGGSETWSFCEGCRWRECTLQVDQSAGSGTVKVTALPAATVKRDWLEDRRRVNLPVAVERRKGRHDRRVCPECHSPLQQFVRRVPQGSLTRTYCVRCGWAVESRQDNDPARAGKRLASVTLPAQQAVKPMEALREMALKRLERARAEAQSTGKPVQRDERRKVNVPVAVEQRHGQEKRKCPSCGSSLQQSTKRVAGGLLTRTYCTKCEFSSESRQVDEERLRAQLGFQAAVLGSNEKPWLELSPDFIKAAGLQPGDTVFFEPIYTPGSADLFKWVVKAHKGG